MESNKLAGFARRHIGINQVELDEMLEIIGFNSIDKLVENAVPDSIRSNKPLNLPTAMSEFEYLNMVKSIASENKVFKSYIGQGYYDTIVPSVILRNIFENPGWYTQYTPYQAEISQGRLEALLNFQTMVADLTGLPIANASLLDEATAAAEAMTMSENIHNKKRKKNPATKFFVDENVFGQTLDVVITRSQPLNIEVVTGKWEDFDFSEDYFGVLVQYPDARGSVNDYRDFTAQCNEKEIQVVVIADIMSLAVLESPGSWGADTVVGNTQRFGVPMGYGGPHAAYFATKEDNRRLIPGRIIGVSVDVHENPALRMALQTREQHIRREKATSNICTAQALLAIMAGMYAVYHGPDGIKAIANKINKNTSILHSGLTETGFQVENKSWFDTLTIKTDAQKVTEIRERSVAHGMNFFYHDDETIVISLDETTSLHEVKEIISIFKGSAIRGSLSDDDLQCSLGGLKRTEPILVHPVFSMYHTESKMMRYIKSLENKDLSLVHSMISLGSCTMKLNAATEMIPVSWPEFANIHPFAPENQTRGYRRMISELEEYLSEITGLHACSLQPNSGAQGEYSGLLTIRAYHHDRGDHHRDIVLIPSSAHGTNPASAVLCGMKVVVVKCDDNGNVDVDDLREKAEQYRDVLSCLMITYPSTHGVFENSIITMCRIIHDNGGLVYMDGANMNAQVGLTNPGIIGADVCHLNLHKTFAIPHGGGGPGMGPICANEKLAPFLPGHRYAKTGGNKAITAVSAAPFGSSSILLISYGYIRMLGTEGLTNATRYAILNANYLKKRLEERYSVLYTGESGYVAHEMIVDLRPFKPLGINAEDVAKRLMDFGFHAPTMSFPVVDTIMIEPTESEDKDELDRFVDALMEIREEIDQIARGEMDAESNVLKNAPHTALVLTDDVWSYSYSRQKAAYPLPYLKQGVKFWPSVGRVDNAHGDRNLICTCPPLSSYEE